MCDSLGPARDRRLLYPAAGLLFRMAFLAASLLSVPSALAQTPSGRQLQLGPAGVPGIGFQIGYVVARNVITRELNVVADLSSFRSDGDVQVAAAVGGSIRLLGIGRAIGNAYYRGWDIDLGMRIGPGLLFEFRESRASKNRRFNLFLEPFVRVVAHPRRATFFAEFGAQRPAVRGGLWIGL